MGMFDTLHGSDGSTWQTKAYNCLMENFRIGDEVPGPPFDYQVEVLGGPDRHSFQNSFATVYEGFLSSVPSRRIEALPLLDYGGNWKRQP